MSYGQHLQVTSVALIFLLFAPPSVAVRVNSEDGLDLDLDEDYDETMSAEEEEEVLASANRSQYCGLFNRWDDLKRYYFEFKFADKQSDSAMELVRDPTNPKLLVYENAMWWVRKDVPLAGGYRAGDKVASLFNWNTIHQGDVGEVKGQASRPGNRPDRINVDFPAMKDVDVLPGSVHQISSTAPPADQQGKQYPLQWQVVGQPMDNGQQAPVTLKEIDLRSLKTLERLHIPLQPPDGSENKDGEEMIGIKLTYENNETDQFVGGLYMPTRLMLASLEKGSDENGQQGGEQYVQGQRTELTPEMRSLPKAYMSIFTVAQLGLPLSMSFGLLAMPYALGAGAGIIAGGVAMKSVNFWDYRKQRRELGLSATEKIWKKMRCHAWFKHCTKDIVVPHGKPCPPRDSWWR